MKQFFVKIALEEAKKALKTGDVPVGCVITYKGEIIAKDRNKVEELSDPTAHAEILAISTASKKIGIKKLRECEIYVTLEPCPMCAGAIALAGFKKLYFGAFNLKHGAVANRFFIAEEYQIPWEHIPCKECEKLLKEFFKKVRKGSFKLYNL
ncbi:MAG TPA: nucleoside deaminase [Aquifex aeolicus]|uniref:Nucleoside deaminase n=1 Tax=Aquifex aeolicus TaxID=63363 RepID=A0A9D0YPS6_AQUAO|nr:nucleoside deaminase [Aquificales bacterium]HIP98476.1 nucleoside deaminase [Aquifex aeolicus]HIQ25837.1 nucleoside deaminase [Aquifex aeolicus]